MPGISGRLLPHAHQILSAIDAPLEHAVTVGGDGAAHSHFRGAPVCGSRTQEMMGREVKERVVKEHGRGRAMMGGHLLYGAINQTVGQEGATSAGSHVRQWRWPGFCEAITQDRITLRGKSFDGPHQRIMQHPALAVVIKMVGSMPP
jgi:hypothetical protein